MVIPNDVEYELLSNVLDGLDDLYDRQPRAVWWMKRLLIAIGLAFAGTTWEEPMTSAAAALTDVMQGAGGEESQTQRAVVATDDLRLLIADRWAQLDGQH